MNQILSYVSVIIGVAGLIYAIWQRRTRIRMEQVLDNYLCRLMEQVQSIIIYRDDLRSVLSGIDNPKIKEWAIENYKGCSDIYRTAVDHFLATRAHFTFKDLNHLIKAGVITTYWEEGIWRAVIGYRPENQGEEPPPYFLKDNKKRRHKYFEVKKKEKSFPEEEDDKNLS